MVYVQGHSGRQAERPVYQNCNVSGEKKVSLSNANRLIYNPPTSTKHDKINILFSLIQHQYTKFEALDDAPFVTKPVISRWGDIGTF